MCSVLSFKTMFDFSCKNIVDHPCIRGFNNSLNSREVSIIIIGVAVGNRTTYMDYLKSVKMF